MDRDDFQSLSKAHYNLSLMYTKKGWWDYALEEAELCFKLQPTKKHFELLDLIKQRSELENSESQIKLCQSGALLRNSKLLSNK